MNENGGYHINIDFFLTEKDRINFFVYKIYNNIQVGGMLMKWFDNDNRWVKILDMLEKDSKISEELLSTELNVSSKTIKNDIKKIKSYIGNYAVLDYKNGHYSIYVLDYDRYRVVKNELQKINGYFESPIMRIAFIYDSLYRSNSPILLDELAYAMNVGRTTLISDINKLKKYIDEYDIKIVGKTNSGISISGDEYSLRFFILDNIYNIIYEDFVMDEGVVSIIENLAKNHKFDKSTVKNFIQFLTVSVDRIQSERFVKIDKEKKDLLKDNPFYDSILNIKEDLEEILKINIPEDELIFISTPVVGMRTPVIVDGIEKMLDIPQDIYDLVERIILEIKEEYNIDVRVGEVLNEFIYHVYFLTNRIKYGYSIKDPMSHQVIRKYPVAYMMAMKAREIIEEEYNVSIGEDELSFLTSYFEIFIVEEKKSLKKPYNICLICGAGKAVSRLIMGQLKSIFDSNSDFDLVSDIDLDEKKLDNYDLIVSTSNINIDTITPVIVVSEMSSEDMLRKKIESYRYIKKLNIPIINGINSILFSLLDPNKFVIIDSHLDYSDSLSYMMDVLKKRGEIDEMFEKTILDRESSSPMYIDENIAFPHANLENISKPIVSIGIRKGDSAKGISPMIIFLVGVPSVNTDSTLLVQLYDEVLEISNSKEEIHILSQSDNYQELMFNLISQTELFRRE